MFEEIDHGKFFVIVGISGDCVAGFFFINSNIHPSLYRKPEQLALQYPMRQADYPFLRYDSFLCATNIITRKRSDLASANTKKSNSFIPVDFYFCIFDAFCRNLLTFAFVKTNINRDDVNGLETKTFNYTTTKNLIEMKKVMLLAVALLAFCAAKAQPAVGDFNWGAKVGFNISNITNCDKNKLSLHLGAFAEKRYSDLMGASAELIYSRQGFRGKDKDLDVKYKTRVNYLNIPILAKFFVWEGLSVDVGPQFGFAINAKTKAKVDGSSAKTKLKDFNVFDFSIPIGVTYRVEDIFVSARYNIGLTDVFDAGVNNKNHVFQLSIGYNLSSLF